MKIALGVPGTGDVPAIFAFDLANLVGHLAADAGVEVRIMMSDQPFSVEVRDEIVAAAAEWGAEVMLFPKVNDRVPANLLDAVIEKLRAPKIDVVTPLGAASSLN